MDQNDMHSDEQQDESMIKDVLQKIIDEMDGLEAQRINPKAAVVKKAEVVQEPQVDDSDLDPSVLNELLSKVDSADENGELPEDKALGLPDEVMLAIKKKREMKA